MVTINIVTQIIHMVKNYINPNTYNYILSFDTAKKITPLLLTDKI